jgi:hypothetical protein
VLNLYAGRAIIVMIVGSILSIVAVKYFSSDLASGVPMTTPAEAAAEK